LPTKLHGHDIDTIYTMKLKGVPL